jgi:hypothetical protein
VFDHVSKTVALGTAALWHRKALLSDHASTVVLPARDLHTNIADRHGDINTARLTFTSSSTDRLPNCWLQTLFCFHGRVPQCLHEGSRVDLLSFFPSCGVSVFIRPQF